MKRRLRSLFEGGQGQSSGANPNVGGGVAEDGVVDEPTRRRLVVVDAHEISRQRPDRHKSEKDCLHYW